MRKPRTVDEEAERAQAYYLSVGQRIRELRGIRKISQKTLAELSDIKAPYLNEIELAGINLSLKMLLQLAAGLGVDPRDLLPGGEVAPTAALAGPVVTQKVLALRDEITRLVEARCNDIVMVIDEPGSTESH